MDKVTSTAAAAPLPRARPLVESGEAELHEMAFARSLKDARSAANMTQTELATRTGRSRDYVGRLERGNGLPDRHFILSLRDHFPNSAELERAYERSRRPGSGDPASEPGTRRVFDVVGIGMSNMDLIAGTSALSRNAGQTVAEHGDRFEWNTERVVDGATFDRALGLHDADVFDAELGGSTFNTIRTLAETRLGLDLGYVSVLGAGEPCPAVHRDALQRLGIDDTFVETIDGPSGRCISYVEDGERVLLTNLGANAALGKFFERRFYDLADYLSHARLIHLASLPDAHTERMTLELLRRVKAASPLSTLCIDPGHLWLAERRPALDGLFRLADYVLVTYREFKLLGRAVPGQTDDEIAQQAISRCGHRTSIVVIDRYDRIRMFRRHGDGVSSARWDPLPFNMTHIEDATGAGDVFAAGFIAALASSHLRCDVGVLLGATLATTKLAYVGAPHGEATARAASSALNGMRHRFDVAAGQPVP